jgi:hypothetical protein
MSITFDVAVDGSFTHQGESFAGLKSSYTATRSGTNQNYYYYNRNTFEFGDSVAEITVYHGADTEYQKRCHVVVGLGPYSWVQIDLECYAQILTAKVDKYLGNGGVGWLGVTFPGDGGAWNGSSASFPISEPALTLPIRVYGEFSYYKFFGQPYIIVPFDYTITSVLPFEEMGQ